MSEVKHVVVVRSDSIGDTVLAGGMLTQISQTLYPAAAMTVICQNSAAPLYEKCPLVARTIAFDRNRGFAEPAYREELARQIAVLPADVCLNTVYSRDPLNDYLSGAVNAPLRIAHAGDTANITPDAKAINDRQYARLVDSPGAWKPEIERHRDLLRALGVEASLASVMPQIWTDPADAQRARALFEEHGLKAGETIALFAGGQFAVRDYLGFGSALAGVCRERGWKVVALGAPREEAINRRNLEALPGDLTVDLTGKTSIREAAEIVRLCPLAVGAETSLSHIACAVGIANVIILGGGHFGRFMPYSPLTTAACLPITCYACNWNCRFERPHCVTDVSPAVLEQAIRLALDEPAGDKSRVVAQDRSLWRPTANQPQWGWFHNLLDRKSIELITVGQRDGKLIRTKIRPPRRHTWAMPLSELTQRRMSAAASCLQASPEQLPAVYAAQVRPLAEDGTIIDMPAAAEERLIVDELLSGLPRGENDPYAFHYRAAALLYFRMHELTEWDPTRIPSWLFDDFVTWSVRQPGLFSEIGEADEYFRRLLAWFERAIAQLGAIPQDATWRRLAEPMSLRPNLIPAYFTSASMLPLLRARSDIIEMYMRSFGSKLDMDPPPRPGPGKKIRIGILKNHWAPGTETYATLPLFEHLPRERFEVVLFVLQETREAAEAHCKSKADRFVVLPLNLSDQVELLRGPEKCDVLFYAINMTAVTHNLVPLSLYRLAPVQMTSICSPATTGLLNMDYFLAGELTEPRDDAQEQYREKLVKVAGSGICFDYSLRPPASNYVITREMLNISPQTVVFTSGSNFFKIIPELRRAWAKLLAAAPDTVLMMFPFGPAWTDSYPAVSFMQSFYDDLRAQGVDIARLILLQPMESPSDVPKVMAITDVYLDSFPYTGATSLLDPLEAGVPPVTMAGDRLRFAQGDALLRELGMPELIATSEDDYIRIATELARDPELRERTRQTVREKMAAKPAFLDSQSFSNKAAGVIEALVRDAGERR